MQIKKAPVKDLVSPEWNPRQITTEELEKLKTSLEEFGYIEPIIVNDVNNHVVGGNQRLRALIALGYDEVDCVYVHIEDINKEKACNVALNKISGDWDEDKLRVVLEDIELSPIDIKLTGFDELELTELEVKEPITVHEDEFNLEDDDELEVNVKEGDLFKLGEHYLLCGDSTVEANVKKLMQGAKADMVFTDPPYQLETQGGGILRHAKSMKQIKQNGVDNFDPSRITMWSDTNVFCHNKPLIKKYIELAENNKMPYDLTFYKKKNTVPNYKGHLMTDVEYIAIIGKQDPNKGLDKEMYSKCFIGQKDNDNELSYSKPVALCAKYIQLYSQYSVLDLFGGSGSTLIACEQLNRQCYMMELDPYYCQVIINRWEEYTGRKAEKIN